MKRYNPWLTVQINRKGVIDVDTVKGCKFGMSKYPNGGCYGVCYASKMAKARGFDFSISVSRYPHESERYRIAEIVDRHHASWFRIGTMGDPCHNWDLTIKVAEWLSAYKAPVIITKHWIKIPDSILERMARIQATINTSISVLDSTDELEYRLSQYHRIKAHGINSVLRIVSAKFSSNHRNKIQKWLFGITPNIDNPLRIPSNDQRVLSGEIVINRLRNISVSRDNAYTGTCFQCPDQCGVREEIGWRRRKWQMELF